MSAIGRHARSKNRAPSALISPFNYDSRAIPERNVERADSKAKRRARDRLHVPPRSRVTAFCLVTDRVRARFHGAILPNGISHLSFPRRCPVYYRQEERRSFAKDPPARRRAVGYDIALRKNFSSDPTRSSAGIPGRVYILQSGALNEKGTKNKTRARAHPPRAA